MSEFTCPMCDESYDTQGKADICRKIDELKEQVEEVERIRTPLSVRLVRWIRSKVGK